MTHATPGRDHGTSVAALEALFGDPWDGDNPCGFEAILAADERSQMLAAGEQVLDSVCFGAEFVPLALGGHFSSLPRLIELGRAVFRRDPCLGLGYGVSSLIAAVNVWSAGSLRQQQRVATLLLANRKLACAYHELEHGNDLARAAFQAFAEGEHLVLEGGKQVIANIERADAIILYARTKKQPGSRSHSQLLVERSALPANCVSHLPRFTSVGMRGVQLGGIEVRGCSIGADNILGVSGQGLETALKTFQVTRVALPGMFMGILDTGLRTTLRYARQRHLYGRAVLDLPHVKMVVVNAFADLMLCDGFVNVVARSMHLAPTAGSVYSAAVKYLVPKLLIDAMTGLSAILGAQFYLRRGPHALFQKLLRDLKPVGFGHAARVTCQMAILPQLPRLAKRAWLQTNAAPVPPAMFQFWQEPPAFCFQDQTLSHAGQDPLATALVTIYAALSADGAHARLSSLAHTFVAELQALQPICRDLPPQELSATASVRSYLLVDRYVTVLAAAACLNLWWHVRNSRDVEADPFLCDTHWIELVLQRLACRLTQDTPVLEPDLGSSLLGELLARHQRAESFDLIRRPLSGWAAESSTSSQSRKP
jgi:alkylation response protein AidB-like acyl-CoA dehydrogenase